MANIDSKLNAIKSAIYGADVRTSIADGIETINTEVESTTAKQKSLEDTFEDLVINAGNSNAEIVVARKGEVDLATKIGKIESSLSDKANKGEISVSDIDKNKGKFDQTYMSDEFLQQMTGATPVNATPTDNSLTTSKYVDRSITAHKTNFINVSSNLFNKATIIANKALDSTTGVLIDNATVSVSDIINISPNTQYTINGISVRRVLYDSAMVFISTATDAVTFTTPVNAVFMRLGIPNAQVSTMQVNKGSTLIAFEEYYESLKTNYIADNFIENRMFNDESINYKQTDFLVPSSNLFDKFKITLNKGLNATTGAETDNPSTDVSDFIEIKASTSYTLYAPIARYVLYDKSYGFISTATTSDIVTTATFTTPSNAKYIKIVMQQIYVDTTQLNEGSVLLDYEKYYLKLKNSKKISASDTDFFTKSSNLFNKNDVIIGKALNPTTGALIDNATTVTSKFIELKSRYYAINGTSVRRVFYDKNYVFISTSTVAGAIEIPPKALYIKLSMPIAQAEILQLNEGAHLLPYEDFYEYINNDHINLRLEDIENVLDSRSYKFSPQEIIGDYTPVTIEPCDGTVVGGFDATTIMIDDIYDKYDALMALYPNYITKELLGNDSSDTLPIYCYRFNSEIPSTLYGTTYKPFPKYIITGGIHGDGTNAGDKPNMVMSLYYFFNDICNQWKDNDVLEYLRWNINFIVVPIQNPWGFNNRNRQNSNAVDLNRNFDSGWIVRTPGTNEYGGTAPFSEVESQYIRDLINANLDAICHVDFHATGGAPAQDKMIYFDMAKESELYYTARYTIERLSHKWDKRNYAGLTPMNFHGYIVDQPPISTCNNWVQRIVGIPSCTLEGFNHFTGSLVTINGIEIMTMCAEEVGNWIWYTLKYFKNK